MKKSELRQIIREEITQSKPWFVQQDEIREKIKNQQEALINDSYNIFMQDYGDKFSSYEIEKPKYCMETKTWSFYVGKDQYVSALGRDTFVNVFLEVRKDRIFYLQVKQGYISSLKTSDPKKAVEHLVKELFSKR